jgi:hypothetical protein
MAVTAETTPVPKSAPAYATSTIIVCSHSCYGRFVSTVAFT